MLRIPGNSPVPLLSRNGNSAMPSDSMTFTYGQRVRIIYPSGAIRIGYVVEDDGGPKVKVRWTAQKRYIKGGRILLHYPRSHEQRFPRDRLEV